MAVPFRRKSSKKVREGRSASNWKFQKKFSTQPFTKCSYCQKIKLLHQVCPNCLTYKELSFSDKKTTEK